MSGASNLEPFDCQSQSLLLERFVEAKAHHCFQEEDMPEAVICLASRPTSFLLFRDVAAGVFETPA